MNTPVTKAFKILAYVTAALVGLLGLVFASIICGMIVELFLKGIGMAVSEYHRYDCKVELAKAGRTPEDIKEICK